MALNRDQRALLRWLVAGLAIPEVRDGRGDSRYLLGNMVAKYSLSAECYAISRQAFDLLLASGADPSNTFTRSFFYGRSKPYIYEHLVPVKILRNALLASDGREASIVSILEAAGPVVILLRTEDARLRARGLASSMPEGWQLGQDPLCRYHAAGIKLSGQAIALRGSICR